MLKTLKTLLAALLILAVGTLALGADGKPKEPAAKPNPNHLPAEEIAAIKAKADKGDLKAQYRLFKIYGEGKEAPMNMPEAAKWAQKSAEAGDPNAQVTLAVLYGLGMGFPPDLKKTELWVRKAAGKGDPLGQACLGYLYWQGLGVKQDYAEAYKWVEKSGSQGNPVGQVGLGMVFTDGLGKPKDPIKGYMWLDLATTSGAAALKSPPKGDWSDMVVTIYQRGLLLDTILNERNEAGQTMSKAQIEKAQKLAADWRKKNGK